MALCCVYHVKVKWCVFYQYVSSTSLWLEFYDQCRGTESKLCLLVGQILHTDV